MNIHDYNLFEECVADIFSQAGFSVNRSMQLDGGRTEVDIAAELDDATYYVEVKYSPIVDKAARRIYETAKKKGTTPILVTASNVDPKKRESYQTQYPELILIDIANLLFAVKDNAELRTRLISVLPYSIDAIEPCEGFLRIDSLQHDDHTKSLIEEMRRCQAGKSMARSYEVLCRKLLENVFSDDLALWREQQKSNDDLYRFDLLCRIKDGNQKTFWGILERYFNSKYIIFEFKNYSEKITQKEVYTTEKYLYAKALRSVGIIIAANGYDDNALWAAKGCLRENGKLIILLDTEDLIAMNEMEIDNEGPSGYLLNKLDDLLSELEK